LDGVSTAALLAVETVGIGMTLRVKSKVRIDQKRTLNIKVDRLQQQLSGAMQG